MSLAFMSSFLKANSDIFFTLDVTICFLYGIVVSFSMFWISLLICIASASSSLSSSFSYWLSRSSWDGMMIEPINRRLYDIRLSMPLTTLPIMIILSSIFSTRS